MLEDFYRSLSQVYDEARGCLSNLESQSAKITVKLRELGKRPAVEVDEEQVQAITDFLYTANGEQTGSTGMHNDFCLAPVLASTTYSAPHVKRDKIN